jgi:hypothetical protein
LTPTLLQNPYQTSLQNSTTNFDDSMSRARNWNHPNDDDDDAIGPDDESDDDEAPRPDDADDDAPKNRHAYCHEAHEDHVCDHHEGKYLVGIRNIKRKYVFAK